MAPHRMNPQGLSGSCRLIECKQWCDSLAAFMCHTSMRMTKLSTTPSACERKRAACQNSYSEVAICLSHCFGIGMVLLSSIAPSADLQLVADHLEANPPEGSRVTATSLRSQAHAYFMPKESVSNQAALKVGSGCLRLAVLLVLGLVHSSTRLKQDCLRPSAITECISEQFSGIFVCQQDSWPSNLWHLDLQDLEDASAQVVFF